MTEIVHTWAQRITAAWRQGFDSVMLAGVLLMEAKKQLPHGDFLAMVETELPFGRRVAQKLMVIAADERIAKASKLTHLPQEWTTLYELTRLDNEQFEAAFDSGAISAEAGRGVVAQFVKKAHRESRERILGVVQRELPNEKCGVIVADPEWRFEPWSRTTGMDRAADNHYPTSCLEVIAARDVPSIAADDCVLFLWATIPMLPHALLVMGAWGFDYKSHYVWEKDKIGLGYWNREIHELLLIGTRGKVIAPAPGTQRHSVIHDPRGEHSAKPECFLELIEGWYPTLPKIELNRRGPARPGWHAWGNQAEPPIEHAAAQPVAPAATSEPACADPHAPQPQAHAGLPVVEDDHLDIPQFLRRSVVA